MKKDKKTLIKKNYKIKEVILAKKTKIKGNILFLASNIFYDEN